MIERCMEKNTQTIEWQQTENAEEAAEYLGREISREIEILKKNRLLFFVSGGSCLKVLPQIKNQDFSGVTVAVLDERYDETNENNNFSQLRKLAWTNNFLKKGGTLISTKVLTGDTQQKLLDRFQKQIEKWIVDNENGRMLALFGMGEDGHTAGIFPESEKPQVFDEMFDSRELFVAYVTDKNKFPKRITATNALFKKLEMGFAFICGQEKEAALHEFKQNKKRVNELPVLFLRNVKRIKIVTDIVK